MRREKNWAKRRMLLLARHRQAQLHTPNADLDLSTLPPQQLKMVAEFLW